MNRLALITLIILDLFCTWILLERFPWQWVVGLILVPSVVGYLVTTVKAGCSADFIVSGSPAPIIASARFRQSSTTPNLSPSDGANLIVGTYVAVLFLIPGPITTVIAGLILLFPPLWNVIIRRIEPLCIATEGNFEQ